MNKEVDVGDVVTINKDSEFMSIGHAGNNNPPNTYGRVVTQLKEDKNVFGVWFRVLWENGSKNAYRASDLDIHLKFSESTDGVRSMLYPKLFSPSVDQGAGDE